MKSYTCDICKKETHQDNLLEIKHRFGYGTELDDTEVELDVCEECFIEKFKEVLSVPDSKHLDALINSQEFKEKLAQGFS